MKDWAKSVAGTVRRTADAALRASQRMVESVENEALEKPPGAQVSHAADEELPVVARMVVEVRSDGSRTVARGALEDIVTGQRVAVDARGDSPVQLAASLASTLLKGPFLIGKLAGVAARRTLTQATKPGGKSPGGKS